MPPRKRRALVPVKSQVPMTLRDFAASGIPEIIKFAVMILGAVIYATRFEARMDMRFETLTKEMRAMREVVCLPVERTNECKVLRATTLP